MIYFDNAATTKPSQLTIDTFKGVCENTWGNPSSTMYDAGNEARYLLSEARKIIADVVGCEPEHVLFTSGSTEGANMVMKGVIPRGYEKNSAIITTKMEHPCIYNTALYLQSCGANLSFVKNTRLGDIIYDSLEEELERARDYRRILVCCMAANNETGNYIPAHLVAEYIFNYEKAELLVDITQAISDPRPLPTAYDYAIASAHKFGGLKGNGFVIRRSLTPLVPLIHGGHQEYGYRAGTENVAGIYSMARQLEAYRKSVEASDYKMADLHGYLCGGLAALGGRINGNPKNRMNTIVSVTFDGANALKLISMLALKGIYLSAGAACSSGKGEYSRVLTAMNMTESEMAGTIRISLNPTLSHEDIDELIKNLKEALSWDEQTRSI